jgi:hypothetical protein
MKESSGREREREGERGAGVGEWVVADSMDDGGLVKKERFE